MKTYLKTIKSNKSWEKLGLPIPLTSIFHRQKLKGREVVRTVRGHCHPEGNQHKKYMAERNKVEFVCTLLRADEV